MATESPRTASPISSPTRRVPKTDGPPLASLATPASPTLVPTATSTRRRPKTDGAPLTKTDHQSQAKHGLRTQESPKAQRERAQAMFALLQDTYPNATCELDFDGPFQLIVATVLSAQSTDKGVNKVTPTLFTRCPNPVALASIERSELESIIHSTGTYRAKAAMLQGLAERLIERFDAQVPASIAELTSLPGVGRKTANVVLGHAFGIPGITADTHVLRLSKRMGWSASDKPEQVETDLNALFERADWTEVSDVTIWHGRRWCHAKKAACGACPVAALCPSFGLFGPTDAPEALKLVKE